MARNRRSVTVAFGACDDVQNQHSEGQVDEDAGPRDIARTDDEEHRDAEADDTRIEHRAE